MTVNILPLAFDIMAGNPMVGGSIDLSAAVGHAARCPNIPEDVRQVQRALNRFSPDDGGPRPALAENGKVDGRTDQAIRHFQRKQNIPPFDGIVDREGRTVRRLRIGPLDISVTDEVTRGRPLALDVMRQGVAAINVVWLYHSLKTVPDSALPWLSECLVAFERCFHASKDPAPAQLAGYVRDRMTEMSSQLWKMTSSPEQYYRIDFPLNEIQSYAFSFAGRRKVGGHWQPYDPTRIYFTPVVKLIDDAAMAYALVHEHAHYVDAFSTDYAYFHVNRARFDGLFPRMAMINGDSYSQFIFQIAGQGYFRMQEHWRFANV